MGGVRRKPFPYSQEVLRLTYKYDPDTGRFSYFDGKPVRVTYNFGRLPLVDFGEDHGRVSLARLLWLYVHNEEPDYVVLIGDARDWRMSNMRSMTASEYGAWRNQQQRAGIIKERVENRPRGSHGTSRTAGVSFIARDQRWQACVTVNGKTRYLGKWRREEDAAAAVEAHKQNKPPPVPPDARGGDMRRGSGASGVPGVRQHRRRWQAYAHKNRQIQHIGLFATKEEAIAARKKWEEENGAA